MFSWAMVGALVGASLATAQTLPTLSATPATLTFTHQIGAALPAAQAVAIKRSGSGTALDFVVTMPPGAPWLIATPLLGKTGTSVSVRVNPATLTAGTYPALLTIDATGSSGPTTVSVVLLVKNPPPVMSVAPATLSFTFQTDAAAPAAQNFTVATDGEPVSFTAVASGGTWLSASPGLGIAVAGSPITISVSVDVSSLTPGAYTGRVTVTSSNASNKTSIIGVTLNVTPGTAVLTSVWPNLAPVGSNDIAITIRGSHLFKQSSVYAGVTSLTATWISTSVMLATVPKALLATQGPFNIAVTNSPQPASNPIAFTVTPPGPQVQAVVNSASFTSAATPAISPGEIISIYGSDLGPAAALFGIPQAGAFPTTIGSPATTVEFELTAGNWTAAPLIMAQANQINLISPFALAPPAPPATTLNLRVTHNSMTSAPFPFTAVDAHPGVFTTDSSGNGQSAALNYDASKMTFSLNTAANPAAKGGIVVVFLTGGGATNPLPNPDGQIIPVTPPAPVLTGTVSVTIGGDAASVQSATAVPGSVAGLTQLNITVPTTVKAGKDLPLMVTINGNTSPLSATLSVK